MAYKRRGSTVMAQATLWWRCCYCYYCCCWLAQLPLVVHAVVDVVAQLHHLQQQHQASSAAGTSAGEKIMLQNVPGALSTRLSEKQLRWQDLSPLQQRALLWDTGLVLTSEERLVQVFVPCGKTMSQIFLPKEAFESSSSQKKKPCAVESCATHSNVRFASANCSVTAVQHIVQCAIEEDDEVGAAAAASSNSSLWSEDGDIESVPDIRVYRYQVWTATSSIAISNSTSNSSSSSSSGGGTISILVKNESTPILFTINQQQQQQQTAESGGGRCSTGASSFIAPCIQRVAANRDEWCAPARGGYLDFWLDAQINATTTGGSTTANSSSSSSAGMSTASVVLIVLSALVAGVLIGFGASRLYRKTQQQLQRGKGLTVTTMRASGSEHESPDEIATLSGAEYRQSIPALLSNPAQLFANTMRDEAATMMMLTTNNNSSSNIMGNSTHSSVLQGSDVAALNESICRRSIEMSTFCADRVLMGKRIQYAEITFEKMLARGANGEVWKGEFAGQVVAIKQLLQEKRHDKSAIEQFAKEIRLASSLEHSNIVKFVGFSWKRLSDMCTVSEFMGKGDLSDLINSTLSGRMTWNQEKLSIAIDIANALAYLHSLDPLIIHRDLKSLNVLLNNNLEAKLSDFGLSRTRSFEETMTCGVGTLLWTAPEILRGEAYTEKADIFSYGIVLSELDTCLPPYALNDEVSKQQLTSMQLINLVAKGRIKPKFRGDIPVALERLATSCVAEDPAKRPNAMQIVLALTSKVLSSHVSKS